MVHSNDEIKPLPRNPLRFDLLQMLEAHVRTRGGALQDQEMRHEFIASLGGPLAKATLDSALLRGLQTESLFESLVVSLGQIQLIKHEDAGTTWAARDDLKIPDYRVVLADGSMFLAEVKHFYQRGSTAKAFPVSRSYLAGLRAYGELVGCPVKLAVYWSRWNLWTLVPLALCQGPRRASLSMERALISNEMVLIGDRHIGTRFPLRLRLVADTTRDRRVGDDGVGRFTVGGVELYCEDRRLTLKREQQIAMWFMLHGKWEEEAPTEIVDGDLVAVDFTRTPPVDHGQGFEIVGSLSSLFSSMYRDSTSSHEGVTRLGMDTTAGSLGSLIAEDYESDELPLWRLALMPGGMPPT